MEHNRQRPELQLCSAARLALPCAASCSPELRRNGCSRPPFRETEGTGVKRRPRRARPGGFGQEKSNIGRSAMGGHWRRLGAPRRALYRQGKEKLELSGGGGR